MVKFGVVYGVWLGIYVGVDIFVESLQGCVCKVLIIIVMLGGILFIGIIIWIGMDFVWYIWKGGQILFDLEMLMWIIYLVVLLGLVLMCFCFVQVFYLYLIIGYIVYYDYGVVDGIEDEVEIVLEGKV